MPASDFFARRHYRRLGSFGPWFERLASSPRSSCVLTTGPAGGTPKILKRTGLLARVGAVEPPKYKQPMDRRDAQVVS